MGMKERKVGKREEGNRTKKKGDKSKWKQVGERHENGMGVTYTWNKGRKEWI